MRKNVIKYKTHKIIKQNERDEILEDEEEKEVEVNLIGSNLDNFLRRCLVAQGQMMFE